MTRTDDARAGRWGAAALGVAGAVVGLGSAAGLTIVASLLALVTGLSGAASVVRWDAETAETRFGVAVVAAVVATLGVVAIAPVAALPGAVSSVLLWLALRRTRAVQAADRRAWAERARIGSEALDPQQPVIPRSLVEREHPVLGRREEPHRPGPDERPPGRWPDAPSR